jgi:imidazolonepropionase-like amidohydrolase
MVEAGMPALSAIRSATLEAATLLGIEKTAGVVDVGKWADIVATPEDPTQDITTMQRVSFVMKNGVIHTRP